MEIVKEIIGAVRGKGDGAVRYYTKKFDNIDLADTEVTKNEIRKAYDSVSKETISALRFAKKNIRGFFRKVKTRLSRAKI